MFERAPKLEKTFRRYPQAPLFARLADHYLRKGRLMRAQALCEEGCERFPSYPTGFFVLSRCYERQRMWEEARTALDHGLRLDPDNPAGYRRLALVYREMGNETLALKCLERAAALDPLSETLGFELEQMLTAVRNGARRGAVTPVAEVPAPTPEPTSSVTAMAPEPPPSEPTSPLPAEPPPTVSEGVQSPPDAVPAVDEPTSAPEPEAETDDARDGEAASELVAEQDEGLFDEVGQDEEMSNEEEMSNDETVDEPFGQVQIQPEWEDGGAEAGEDSEPDDIDESEPAPVEEEPPGDDEVAALGEGLFEDDDASPPAPEPVPPARLSPTRTASKPVSKRASPPAEPERLAGVSQLPGRHTKELTALLLEFDLDSADSAEETEDEIEALAEPVATLTLADLYARQGHHEQALEIYQRILSADPDNAAARRGGANLSAT
jgi:tetratricopeptide (TPR) repeat protein